MVTFVSTFLTSFTGKYGLGTDIANEYEGTYLTTDAAAGQTEAVQELCLEWSNTNLQQISEGHHTKEDCSN